MSEFLAALEKQGYRAIRYADDQDVVMYIQYIGSEAFGNVKVVTSADDIEFKHGALAAGAADTTIQIGSVAGAIDMTDDAADNLGQVVDHINSSANWKASLIGALRADRTQTSTTTNLLTQSAVVQAKSAMGAAINWDTSTFLSISVGICPEFAFPLGSFNKQRSQTDLNKLRFQMRMAGVVSKNTYATGTSVLKIYEDQTLKMQWDGGATTVEQFKNMDEVFTQLSGKDILLRMTGSGFCTGYLQTWYKVVPI